MARVPWDGMWDPQLSTWASHLSTAPLNSHPPARSSQWMERPLAAMALSILVHLLIEVHLPV